jgi:succinate dehydrogenase/fumarate reductase cytochrome b subunit (b558 family)
MSEPASDRRAFVLRRLHSLAGVVPLGIFLLEHLVTNASALYGRRAFDSAVSRVQSLPGLVWLEVLGIFAPLAFHALYGVFIATRAKVNVGRYPFGANWLFTLQRASGLLALGFIAAHLWHFRVAKAQARLEASDFYPAIERTLSQPGLYALYLMGLTATVFHFANGLRTAGDTWGIATTPRARRNVAVVCAVTGCALWALGVNTLYHFVLRCGGLLPMPMLDRATVCGV